MCALLYFELNLFFFFFTCARTFPSQLRTGDLAGIVPPHHLESGMRLLQAVTEKAR